MEFSKLISASVSIVAGIQQELPVEIRSLAEGVNVHYESRPSPDILQQGFADTILGLFSGNPHGRELSQPDPAPPQITFYLENIWEWTEADLGAFQEEVRLTYLHELGHYFGWDEDDLAARGLD